MIYPSAETNYVEIPLLRGSEYVVGEGNTNFKLYEGSTLLSETNEVIEPSSTVVYELQPIVLGEGQYEDYTLRVQTQVGLKPFVALKTVRVGNYQTLTVTPEQVRSRLGLGVNDIPDERLNIVDTYFQLVEDYSDTFHVERQNNKGLNRKFMELVTTTVASLTADGLAMTLSEREETDNNVFVRLGKAKDLTALAERLRTALNKAKSALEDFAVTPSFVPSVELMIVADRPDVVTGA